MKKCSCCGIENSDAAVSCSGCHNPLATVLPDQDTHVHVSTAAMQSFWERMTFKQLALFITRIQGVFFLFGSVVDLTYLPKYFQSVARASSISVAVSEYKLDLFLALLRVIMHFAAGMALIQHGEKFLDWLMKDLATDTKPDDPEKVR